MRYSVQHLKDTTMKNSLYLKIIAVLAAFSMYVFLFGFVRKIGGEEAPPAVTDENGSIVTTETDVGGDNSGNGGDSGDRADETAQGARIDVANIRPPSYLDYDNPLPVSVGGELVTDAPDPTTTTAATVDDGHHGDGASMLPENATTSEPLTTATAAATTPPAASATTTATATPATTAANTATPPPAATTLSPKAEDLTAVPAATATTKTTATAVTATPEPDITTRAGSGENEPVGIGELYVRTGGKEVRGDALDIVSRIVECEVGSSFSPEAIKAQAVASYTYVKYANERGTAADAFLAASPSAAVKAAVASVLGEGVYYNGKLIQAVYSASSPGYTADSANVWGGELPYLKSRECDFDEKYDPNYGLHVSFTADDIKKRVYNKTGVELSGDPAGWIEIVGHTDHVYVAGMRIGGTSSYVSRVTGNTIPLNGRTFRENILEYDLKSAAFDFKYDADSDKFNFTTYGYGHGVGMQQNGANILAKHYGYNYKEILEFYYAGATVK